MKLIKYECRIPFERRSNRILLYSNLCKSHKKIDQRESIIEEEPYYNYM